MKKIILFTCVVLAVFLMSYVLLVQTIPTGLTTITPSVSNCQHSITSGSASFTAGTPAAIQMKGIVFSEHINPVITNPELPWTTTICRENGGSCGTTAFTATTAQFSIGIGTWHVRSFAVNPSGIGYGPDVVFTIPGGPTETTATPINITDVSATLGGTVLTTGGGVITERGVCFAPHPEPRKWDSAWIILGSGLGSFSGTVNTLQPNTKYWAQAYATNSICGTTYGPVKTFWTTNQ
jgi:hypothetical protein